MEKKRRMSREGYESLKHQLEHLINVERVDVAQKLKEARSYGDLSENAEYDEAKNEQAKIEARIADLEAMLKNVKIISDEEISGDKVHVGSTIRVRDMTYKEETVYQIVGSAEADPRKGKISDDSPVGRALLGCAQGKTVEVETPGGMVKYKVLEIMKNTQQ